MIRCSCGATATWELPATREPVCARHAAMEAHRGRVVVQLVSASPAWATPPPMPRVTSRA